MSTALPKYLDPASGHRLDAPYVLLPYQQRWIKDKSPVKVWEKSRRIGASWGEASDDALYAASASGANV